jgi:hypothetical protein
MNYLIHATPVHPSLCLQYLIILFTIATITIFTLLFLLLFYYYHHYKIVATDKPLRASLFPGAAELITHLLRLINILWLPLCRINKFGFYFPRRLLRSPILVGHQLSTQDLCSGFHLGVHLWTVTQEQRDYHDFLALVNFQCSLMTIRALSWLIKSWGFNLFARHWMVAEL